MGAIRGRRRRRYVEARPRRARLRRPLRCGVVLPHVRALWGQDHAPLALVACLEEARRYGWRRRPGVRPPRRPPPGPVRDLCRRSRLRATPGRLGLPATAPGMGDRPAHGLTLTSNRTRSSASTTARRNPGGLVETPLGTGRRAGTRWVSTRVRHPLRAAVRAASGTDEW